MPQIDRRGFLAACIGTGTAAAAASFPVATWADVLLAADERPIQNGAGILVLITLYGGNDGLNTVIPVGSATYHDSRPELAYAPGDALALDDDFGLNPGMTGMSGMFHSGSLAIVRGVGYPESDRSHFRSMDIWQSASLDNRADTGWIGRWLDSTGGDPIRAMHLGRVVPPLAVGRRTVGALFSPQTEPSHGSAKLMKALSEVDAEDTPAMRMVCEAFRSATHVNSTLEPIFADNEARFEQTPSRGSPLADRLDAVAACIAAGVPTRVYSVELGGFDTHADGRDTQQDLLTTLDTAISGFMKQISGHKRAKDVVVMAYSEFGRRVAANASDGTDHGTAGPVFIAGERVRGGFYGDDPSLTDLVDGDLKVTTDFRDVYHEILAKGLGSDPEPVLGKERKEIGFLRA